MIKSMLACPYKFKVLYWSFANKIDMFSLLSKYIKVKHIILHHIESFLSHNCLWILI